MSGDGKQRVTAGTGIRIQPNGPYFVYGPITIEDGDGHVISVAEDRYVKLCRCGHSATKPYCDGTHRRVDFVSRPTFEPEPVLVSRVNDD